MGDQFGRAPAFAELHPECAVAAPFAVTRRHEITKAAHVDAGSTVPNLYGPGHSAPLLAYCRVEGVINRRTGVGGEEFGINWVLALWVNSTEERRFQSHLNIHLYGIHSRWNDRM